MEVIKFRVGKKDGAPSKMVEIKYQMEGKGPNLSTSFINMGEVARALGRPPSYINTFIGLEVDSLSKSNEEKGIFHVRGTYDAAELVRAINKFVKTYVECYSCGHPETELILDGVRESVTLLCGDCGSISEVRGHRVVIYMLVHPHLKAEKRPPLEI